MTTPPARRSPAAAKAAPVKKTTAKKTPAAKTPAKKSTAKAATPRSQTAPTQAARARALAAEAAAAVAAEDLESPEEVLVVEAPPVAPPPQRRVEPAPAPKRPPTVTERIYRVTAPIGRVVRIVTTVVCLFILVGIVLALADANTKNDIVRWVLDRSRDLVDPLHDAFKAKTYKGLVFKNWGLSLVVYLALGRLISRLLGHRPS